MLPREEKLYGTLCEESLSLDANTKDCEVCGETIKAVALKCRFCNTDLEVECPATFVPVEMRQTGMRGTGYGTREEAYGGADRESAATG